MKSQGPEEIRPGDWVRPYSRGVWRVVRVMSGFNEFRFSLHETKRRSSQILVFSNRLFNDSWKRSFSSECSAISLVSHVSEAEHQRIEQSLHINSALAEAFERYERQAKLVDLIVNLQFGGLPDKIAKSFESVCDRLFGDRISGGLILDEVLEVLAEHGYDTYMGKNPPVAGLQLVCLGHELRGGDFVLRRYKGRIWPSRD